MSDIRFHELADGRKIAFRLTEGRGPTLVFLPGYMSDMDGGKATALFDWAKANDRSCLLLDYSGCGQSSGDFADGTLSKWREEVLALVARYVDGKIVLVGSSMGGWLMLLTGIALGDRLAGIVGIAAAPDFTDWGYSDAQKAQMAGGETVYEDNPYGPEPTPTHAGFFADGQAQRLLTGPIPIDAPARLIHGHRDDDVPWETSLRLAGALRSGEVQVTFVKDGDHRLSRPQDIALLLRTIGGLLDDLETP